MLTGIAEVVAHEGLIPGTRVGGTTPRKRGLKMGLFIFLLSFLIVPIISIITVASNAEPFVVVISAILLTVGGLLRMAYALMFESNIANGEAVEQHFLSANPMAARSSSQHALPPQQSQSAADFVSPVTGAWRDTNELQHEPSSVTDNTTKLLKKEQND